METTIEQAKTGRARCRTCQKAIAKGELRFGKPEVNAFSDSGELTMRWHHLECAARSIPAEVKEALDRPGAPDVPDREELLAAAARAEADKPTYPFAERSPSGRSRCLQCDETIAKDELRVAIEREVDTGMFTGLRPGYLHPACAREYLKDDALDEKLRANSRSLGEDDVAALEEELG
jgi:hypothetical protein